MWRVPLLLSVALVLVRISGAQNTVPRAQQALLNLSVTEMQTSVPKSVQVGIVALKEALAQQTDATIVGLPATDSAAAVQRALRAVLPAEAVGQRSDAERVALVNRTDYSPVAGLYGGGLRVTVTEPQPGLLLVTESFEIAWGDDNLLLAYQSTTGHWKRVLRWDAGRYDTISGAFGDVFETRILKPVRNGHPLLLVLHGTPWCTSVMSGFGMDVFELGSGQNRPIWHGSHGYRRDDDPTLSVRTTPDGFEVRAPLQSSLREGKVSRLGTMLYAVLDGRIRRVQPIGRNAIESLEEWLSMPRDEARDFADEASGSPTWQMYDRLTWHGVKSEDIDKHWTPEYGPVRSCKDSSKHLQAEMQTSRGYGDNVEHGTTYYVQMTKIPNGYHIHAVTAKPNGHCAGADLMAAH